MKNETVREILFRGKRTDNGEWVEGDFLRPSKICFEEIGEDPVLGQKNVPVWNDYQVVPGTVCQFTGLRDQNGKRIFELDLCLFYPGEGEEPSLYLVKYVVESARFIVAHIRQDKSFGEDDDLDVFFAENSERIGSVWDFIDGRKRNGENKLRPCKEYGDR